MSEDILRKRIQELEQEVAEREQDLSRFRQELLLANSKLEVLIHQLSQELKMAHLVQKKLVPTEFPHIPGFEFSTKFIPSAVSGGDYFDIFEHQDKFRFGVVAASSSGHAMSALFLSVLLRLTSQMEARKGAEPHKVLQSMAEELVPSIEDAASADVFYGLIDRRSYELTYCRMGEVHVLLHSKDTGKIQLIEQCSSPFVKNFNQKLKSKSLLLNSKDRLVICTKGLTVAVSPQGEQFGLERLSKAVLEGPVEGVHELRNHILYELHKFCGGHEPQRDQTILVLEVKDRVIKLAQ